MAITGTAAVFLLVGRVLFGGLIAFQGVNHFMNVDQLTGYADAKGVPAPRVGVVASGVMLILGGLSILAGAYATIGAGMVAVFLLVTSPAIHNFWAVAEEQTQSEMTDFIKNGELLGAALTFLAISGTEWEYAVGVGLF
ncbi:DoxX family protein [Halobacterium noricense]|uniref:DoxX family protein n=1 Tax=Halobacterium noricense TaxID=223182 RepID=UPI001E36E4AD|nr:DoxX family protein [Halobacterium noricense]UHH26250.1 DoxX family protein [Halobacterium noricense]